MTPIRAKRNSKAPERFSSDDIKTDTSNVSNPGHGDKSSNSAAKIKLKPIIREPLKVKLPKLRRPQVMQSLSQAKDSAGTNFRSGFAKIKLPPKKVVVRNGNQDDPFKPSVGSSDQLLTVDVAKRPSGESNKLDPPTQSDLNPSSPAASNDDNESVFRMEDSIDGQSIDMVDGVSKAGTLSMPLDHLVNEEKKTESSPSNSDIRCPCGVDDDLGVMVECEKCSNWQHGHCINVGLEEDAYEGYVCAYCLLPPGEHNDSLQQLAINDRFQAKFEALETFMKHRISNQHGETTDQNQVEFVYDELEVATSDLRRVSNSLEVKWKLLTSDDYNAELRIWKNPIWSDDPNENRKQQQQTVRFVGDIYKSNLKLNICSMLNRMHKRCQLIRYQISRVDTSDQDCQSKFDKLLVTLDGIANLVEKVTDNLKTI